MHKLLSSLFPFRGSSARSSKKKPSWLLEVDEFELSQTRLSSHVDIDISNHMIDVRPTRELEEEEADKKEQLDSEHHKPSFDCRREYRVFLERKETANTNISSHTNESTHSQSVLSNRGNDAHYSFPVIDQRKVQELVIETSAQSALSIPNIHLPSFDRAEVVLGSVLGRGEFSDVSEIRGFCRHVPPQLTVSVDVTTEATDVEALCDSSTQSVAALEESERRDFIIKNVIRLSCRRSNYAMKNKRRKKHYSEKEAYAAILDLHIEARLLQALVHPNIIRIHATGGQMFTPDYFLVLDRLHDTLQKRLKTWSEKKSQLMSDRRVSKRLFQTARVEIGKEEAFLNERLVAAHDLAGAISYMHECRIVHRDIKPGNIGFDIHDRIKLFDLGLARELRDVDRADFGTYNFSMLTGSLRQMAPEVMLGRSYNDRADVYSFSIVLWEMIALERPYACSNSSERQHKQRVCVEHFRPPLQKTWSDGLQAILRLGWDGLIQARSSMEEI